VDEDLGTGAESPIPVLESRLKYGTGMRINAALRVFAEKRLKRKQRKLEVRGYSNDCMRPRRSLFVCLSVCLCMHRPCVSVTSRSSTKVAQ